MAKALHDILNMLEDKTVKNYCDREITDIVYDSRKVTPGSMFICLEGEHVDGHDFVRQAVRQGAVCLLVQKAVDVDSVTVITVKDTRYAMQKIVPYYFDYPAKKLHLIGVTGTNGKTTITHLVRAILMEHGHKVGLMGTIHTLVGDDVLPVKNTTPDVVDLQKTLALMVEKGMEYVVMEVSSHAIEMGRVAGLEYDIGIFTNITRDHLDFHKTFENYINAKAKLFKRTNKAAVINLDDDAALSMVKAAKCPVFGYTIDKQGQLRAENINVHAKGTSFDVIYDNQRITLNLRITGIFNVYNVLAAIGAALISGVPMDTIKSALEKFDSVPGRFELVEVGQDFTVIVDYAHTPDGLENVLKTAKAFTKGQLITVFGCGGDRDRTKRPIMGRIAVEYADVVVITSDNPRSENPEAILDEIEAGIKQVITDNKQYVKICDRRAAIEYAIKLAGKNDVVLIAGKGHETYQILKDKTIDFDDRQVARDIIREMR